MMSMLPPRPDFPQSGLFLMENTIQSYPWGSKDGLATYAGIETDPAEPAAECWMGSHRLAPSAIYGKNGEKYRLDAFIRHRPALTLGTGLSQKYDELPFLFKALSAAKPLSIQVHPSEKKARDGFARENALGIPQNSPARSYKDPHHKPELAVALSSFSALCGFRHPDEAQALMGLAVCSLLNFPAAPRSSDYRPFLQRLLTLPETQRKNLEELARQRARQILGTEKTREDCPEPHGAARQGRRTAAIQRNAAHAAARAVLHCYEVYPEDPGAVAPFFLSLFTLAPGQGIYIPAGVLHSYLDGTILEIMAASDNVIRGGMTGKKIDVAQLIDIVDTDADPVLIDSNKISALCDSFYAKGAASIRYWPTPAQEFELALAELRAGGEAGFRLAGPKIFLCSEGEVTLSCLSPEGEETQESLLVRAGQSVFAPDACRRLRARGTGKLFCAAVSAAAVSAEELL